MTTTTATATATASASTLAPGLSRKLKKVLETRTDSPDLLASLNTLSSFYTDNAPNNRRNLRSTIEKRALSINEEYLLAYGAVQHALDRVEDEVSELDKCCDRISNALSSFTASTGDIFSITERLKQDLANNTQKQEIVSCFLRDYQLTEEEINALREEDLNEIFFKALGHVQEIHSNCKVLLRTHHQRAGLELMDMMAVYQEGAYERLCRWVQTECRRLGDIDNPEVSDLLKIAVRCLRERPVLFKYCAEEVANMRHNALFRRFISALTRGGPGGLPRPIEVHAHDPLRYVGDMLGWLHQAVASEKELVLSLLDPDEPTDTGSKAASLPKCSENDSVKAEPDLTFVLDRIFEGVCRPFKIRVEQVLQSHPSLIVSYKLSNTLEFYSYTMSDLLGSETALCNTLWLLKDASQGTFYDILKTRGEKLLRYPLPVAVDLSPPPAVREGISLLCEIVDTHNSMMVPVSGPKPDFTPVLSAFLDPIIQMCEQAAEAHKSKGGLSRRSRMNSDPSQLRKSSIDAILEHRSSIPISQTNETPAKIFLINCLSAIQQALLEYPAASDYANKLGAMIESHINSLVENEVDMILRKCGLANKMSYFRKLSSNDGNISGGPPTPLAELEDTCPASLSEGLKAFFGIILGSESPLPEFEEMQVPSLRSQACVLVARSLAEAYDLIYSALVEPTNRYPDPKSLARHPPDHIRTILGI